MDAVEASTADVCPKTISTSAGAEWWRYTDGAVWRLVIGVDAEYFSVHHAMDAARAWAKKYGYRLDVRDFSATTLDVRFVLINDAPPVVKTERGHRAHTSKMAYDPTTGELSPQRTFTTLMAESHDGEAHVIRVDDFGVSLATLRSRVTSYASYHGLKYRTRKISDDALEIRLIGKAEARWKS